MENSAAAIIRPTDLGNAVPANSARNTLSRQWELLRLLPTSGSGATAKQLQAQLAEAGFPTTKRTVERDLEDLSTVFAIRKNEKSVPFGFSWSPASSFQASAVSVLDALTLSLAQETLRPLIPSFMLGALEPRFEQASSKLRSLSDKSAAGKWPQKVASVPANLPMLAPKIDPECLACVQQALIDDVQLKCSYYSAHRDLKSDLVLESLVLVQRGNITYLIAIATPYEDVRQFALHRMSATALTETPITAIKNFDLKAYAASSAMQFGDNAGELITLEAWVNEGLLRMLRETPLSEGMETMCAEDGGWIRAKVADSWELEWWLLSHTGSIAVTAPEELKQRVIQRLGRGLALYEE